MNRGGRWPRVATVALLLAPAAGVQAEERVNPHSVVLQDFEQRVNGYIEMRKPVEGALPPLKATPSPEEIIHHQRELAERLRRERRNAKQGDIFTPSISAEFRRLIGITLSGPGAGRIRESLRAAEPVKVKLSVNSTYPSSIPLQSTPPTLLLNLPRLPDEISYRVANHDLLLVDMRSMLVLDFLSNAVQW